MSHCVLGWGAAKARAGLGELGAGVDQAESSKIAVWEPGTSLSEVNGSETAIKVGRVRQTGHRPGHDRQLCDQAPESGRPLTKPLIKTLARAPRRVLEARTSQPGTQPTQPRPVAGMSHCSGVLRSVRRPRWARKRGMLAEHGCWRSESGVNYQKRRSHPGNPGKPDTAWS